MQAARGKNSSLHTFLCLNLLTKENGNQGTKKNVEAGKYSFLGSQHDGPPHGAGGITPHNGSTKTVAVQYNLTKIFLWSLVFPISYFLLFCQSDSPPPPRGGRIARRGMKHGYLATI